MSTDGSDAKRKVQEAGTGDEKQPQKKLRREEEEGEGSEEEEDDEEDEDGDAGGVPDESAENEENVVEYDDEDDDDEADDEEVDDELDPEEGSLDSEQDSADDEEELDEDDSDMDEEDSNLDMDKLDADFEAVPPQEKDFDGIYTLLQNLVQKENVDLSKLTKQLIGQNQLTTVLIIADENDEESKDEAVNGEGKANGDVARNAKAREDRDEDEDVFGVFSAIHPKLKSQSNEVATTVLDQIRKLLGSHAKANEGAVKAINSDNSVFVFHERFYHIPAQVAPPSYRQLVEDLNKAATNESFEFDTIIMWVKSLKQRPAKGKNKASTSAQPESFFVNAEDEVFEKYADHVVEYELSKDLIAHSELPQEQESEDFLPTRKIMVLRKQRWIEAIEKLPSFIESLLSP